MVLLVRKGVQELDLREPARSHALLLMRRLSPAMEEVPDPDAWVAGLEYLAARVEQPALVPEAIAARHDLPAWRMMAVLDRLREETRYRAYVGEWIREGSPRYGEPVEDPTVEEEIEEEIEDDLEEEIEERDPPLGDETDDLLEDVLPEGDSSGGSPSSPVAIEEPVPGPDVPARWQAPFLPYEWQRAAARAWETAGGRGIMEVVTGAGKTALAAFLYARLLDRLTAEDRELQLIVVVPRIELVRQWGRELRHLLQLQGIRLGEYHGNHRCKPELQDILLITQDSARRVLMRMRFDRPTLLVADECHRLGAPAASRILTRPYTWTLGLSATPERGGDLGFEEILVPRLGPVIYRYRYQEAVRDGIIARFRVVRVAVSLLPEEHREYSRLTETITRSLQRLKARYPALRGAMGHRFWQILGALKRDHPEDDSFERLTAATSERRGIVHLAHEKLEVIRLLAGHLTPPTRVLCFHERIEAADQLLETCHQAGRRAVVYHSRIPDPVRKDTLEDFRQGGADWLIACRSLDEGLDVPTVDTIVIAAGSKSPRQLIQRLGRALRIQGGDKIATVYLLEVTGIEDRESERDGLADLHDAADAMERVAGRNLGAWLRQDGEASMDRALSTAAPRKAEPRGAMGTIRRLGGLLRRLGRNTWTGTSDTESYYDKDRSPD